MPQTEQELAKKLVGCYSKMNKHEPASWAVFSDDMNFSDVKLRKPCHMQLRYHSEDKFDNIITALNPDTPEHIHYLTALINGPFRNFNDRIEIVGDKVGKRYIKCTKLNTWPAPVLYNFCIATRIFIEYDEITPLNSYNVVKSFNRMVKAEVPDDLALVLSPFSYPDGDIWEQKVDFFGPNGCHFWLDNKSDPAAVFKGAPKEIAGVCSFKKTPYNSTPCNSEVWGKIDDQIFELLRNKTVREIYEHYKEKDFFT